MLRFPLRMIPSSARMRILNGPARGARWIAGAGPHGIWLGSYERPVQHALKAGLEVGGVFFDIGANAGFYTLLAARIVGSTGRVVAFEPLPENVELLRRHVALNALENVEIRAEAITDTSGRARFARSGSRFTSHLEAEGDFDVPTTSIDSLVGSGAIPPPTVIKMDIEGGETRALAGARRTLMNCGPALILATHGETILAECRRLLEECGYFAQTLGAEGSAGQCELLAVPSSPRSASRRGDA
ncbi:MAG: FkbM family methyltransferase [Rhodocyclaceae bacterium]|nr:FkbM family methyltransferase [Rhodocyclaceae bacterium]